MVDEEVEPQPHSHHPRTKHGRSPQRPPTGSRQMTRLPKELQMEQMPAKRARQEKVQVGRLAMPVVADQVKIQQRAKARKELAPESLEEGQKCHAQVAATGGNRNGCG